MDVQHFSSHHPKHNILKVILHNIIQNLEFGELYITNGLGHTRILKDEVVIQKVIEFILKNNKVSS